jgi:acetyl esterase/lipase
LRARDEDLPLPAAVVLMTPAADLTESGDSHQTNLGLDPLIPGSGKQTFALYAAGQDLRHPYLSPLNGDFSRGFPPAILTTGTRDMLLSDTVLLHQALRRAGIPAELHVTEAGGTAGSWAGHRKTRRSRARSGASRRPTGPADRSRTKGNCSYLERTLAPPRRARPPLSGASQ